MDTRIALGIQPLQVPDQSAALQKALTLNALMGQSDLQGLQVQEAQRTLKRNSALDALAASSQNDDDYMAGLRKIDPAAAYKLQQSRLEAAKTQGEVDKSSRESDAAHASAIINADPKDRPAVYAQLRAEAIANGNKNAANSPPEWNEALLPHIVAQQQKGLGIKDALERQDTFNARQMPPETSPIVKALATSPVDAPPVDLEHEANVGKMGAEMTAAGLTPSPPEQVMPKVNVDAVGANPKIAEYRAEADRQRQKGTKAGNENAKTFMDEAARLEENDVKMRDKFGQATDAPGVVYNKATGEYSMNGKPISAEDIQKVALAYAEAKGTKLTVENYPNPTTMTDPKTGEQKSVQFGKSGSYREVPYKPPSNDSERLAAGYHDRMVAAEKIISDIGSAGNPTATQVAGESLGSVPGRIASTAAQQQYKQAQSDWVRAKLRKESGAVIGPKEMQDEIDTYFPRLGDGPEVIKQKADARAIAQDAMMKNAGPAASEKRRASDKVKTIRFEDLP